MRAEFLTPNMRRLTLGGSGLHDFPAGHESAYVKLVFARPGCDEVDPTVPPKSLPSDVRPFVRSYTVRRFDPETHELTIDLTVHGTDGPGGLWSSTAMAGDYVVLGGPGPTKLVHRDADWFFLAGDMSALPAIAANLEYLPAAAEGYAVIEVVDAADRQPLQAPPGVEVHWVIQPRPDVENGALVDAVSALEWRSGQPALWAAGEMSTVRALKKYFRSRESDGGRDAKSFYASGYWQRGRSDEQRRIEKKAAKERPDASGGS